jgi:hypothetical protein
MERAAEQVQPDVQAALSRVHRLARRARVRRRLVVAVGVTLALVATGVLATVIAPSLRTGDAPVSPPRQDRSTHAVALSVVKQTSAAALGLEHVLNVAVSPSGRVYATDASQRVAELRPDLTVTRVWGSGGIGPSQFRLVQGSVAVGPDGRVYVSDTGNFRIQVFSPGGRYLHSIGSFGTGPGQFTWPFDLAVDGDDNVYVADDKQETLMKLAPDGRQIWRRGGDKDRDPRLRGHEHLDTVDAKGQVLAVNDDTDAVMLFAPSGTVAEQLTGLAAPASGYCGASLDADGRFYLTDCSGHSGIDVFAADGTPAGSWHDAGLAQPPSWGAGNRGYAVTAAGGIAELETTTR